MISATLAGPFGARDAAAQDSSAVAVPWYQAIALNGFVSGSYSYNFNRPPSHLNTYRVFDFDDNTFKVDVVELVAQRVAAKPGTGGFRVDLAFGGSIPRVTAASGLFRDPVTGEAQDVDLQQAFATYVAPLGSGLRVDAGKFVTPVGSEVIEGYDGWNDNATRSFLFGYAIPFTHTGVRAAYTFSPRLSALAMLANGWDDATDNNTAKTGGLQFSWTPAAAFALTAGGMIGADRPGDDRHRRSLGDLVATLKPSPRVSFVFNADLGSEEGLAGPTGSGSAQWSGVAGYVRWQASDPFALIARGETFDDRDGARTGLAQTLSEFTLTPEWHVTPRFVLRADLRADHSSENAFDSSSGLKDSQTTILLNALTSF